MRTLLAALAAVSLAAVAAAADTGPASAATPYRPPRVTVVTDSVGGVLFWDDDARRELAAGLDLDLETKTCRKLVSRGCFAYSEVPPSALETITALGPDLGPIVVVDVGYNDLAEDYAAGLDRVMEALVAAGVRHVVWVTLAEGQQAWAAINDVIHAAEARWPSLTVADWAGVVATHPEWLADGPHLNYDGGIAFARFLRPIVLTVCGAACVPPVPVATLLPPRLRPGAAVVRWTGNDAASTYDVSVRSRTGPWRTVATRLATTSFRITAARGSRLQVRVRGRGEGGAPGSWSAPRVLRL